MKYVFSFMLIFGTYASSHAMEENMALDKKQTQNFYYEWPGNGTIEIFQTDRAKTPEPITERSLEKLFIPSQRCMIAGVVAKATEMKEKVNL